MSKNYIFHHDDMDGYASSLILSRDDDKCIECSYDNVINPFDVIGNDVNVIYIADYSFEPKIMKKLYDKYSNKLIWIDHHVSAIERSKNYKYDMIKGVRDVNHCGAELCYMFMTNRDIVPDFLKHLGDFDMFRTYGTDEFETTLSYFYGYELFKNTYFKEAITEAIMFSNVSDDLMNKFKIGKFILQHQKQKFLEDSKYAYVRNIWGYRVLCMNTNEGGLCLQLPKVFDKNKHDMICTYNYNGKVWVYGFYTDVKSHPEVNCAKIAESYGGGGHKGAAGAENKEFIKELK